MKIQLTVNVDTENVDTMISDLMTAWNNSVSAGFDRLTVDGVEMDWQEVMGKIRR